MNESVTTNFSIIQRYATSFLVGIGVVAAVIITMVWLNRRKYLKLSALLASQINAIDVRDTYDKITARIKKDAVSSGVEPVLRDILKENKLLGPDTWKPFN